MIIVKLIGGLGNQLFQYAFGRRLAILNNTELKLDLSDLLDRSPKDNFTYRDYSLSYFNINCQIAKKKDWAVYFPSKNYTPRIKKFLLKKLNLVHEIYEDGATNRYNPNYVIKTKNCYASGYWQSEKYFMEIYPIIQSELTLKKEYITNNTTIIDDILSRTSVSIHIRRGDYVTNPYTNNFHGVCSMEYYQKAIDYINQSTVEPYFFIFTDDLNWVKKKFNLTKNYSVIEGNPDYIDLYLMSTCKHNIIANSSFSWWGARLNSHPEKIIIAPKKWFNVDNMSTLDLLPHSWLQL